jgi:TolB protein
MADLRDRFSELDRIDAPDVWRRVEGLGPRSPREEPPRVVTRVLVAVFALIIAGVGIALAVKALGRSSSPSSLPPSPTPSQPPTPPANTIVFANAASDSLDARIEVGYVSASGGDVVSLTTAGKDGMAAAEPRWSPDGSRIAFVMSPVGHLTRYAGDGDIYVMNADGTGIRRLTDELGDSSPTWSPDGSQIAFVKGQGQELVVMRADGSDQHVIARARGYYQSPTWSPDGREIAYQSSPNRNIDVTAIFTIRPNGTNERQLTSASAAAGFPAWSPDGSRIAYAAEDQVWIMNSDGTDPHRLTNCRLQCVADFAPSWSPDGSALVFVQQEDDGAARRLYILDLATDQVKPLTPRIRWAGSPDWRPSPG